MPRHSVSSTPLVPIYLVHFDFHHRQLRLLRVQHCALFPQAWCRDQGSAERRDQRHRSRRTSAACNRHISRSLHANGGRYIHCGCPRTFGSCSDSWHLSWAPVYWERFRRTRRARTSSHARPGLTHNAWRPWVIQGTPVSTLCRALPFSGGRTRWVRPAGPHGDSPFRSGRDHGLGTSSSTNLWRTVPPGVGTY
ncbi:hypothetical protein ACVWY2_004465 [Bradyrhizobium sp. JR6.1]